MPGAACPHKEEFAAFSSSLSGYFLRILPVFKEPEIICTGIGLGWGKVYLPFFVSITISPTAESSLPTIVLAQCTGTEFPLGRPHLRCSLSWSVRCCS